MRLTVYESIILMGNAVVHFHAAKYDNHVMKIERIAKEDIPKVMEIIEEARAFQLSYGNMQWADGYPSLPLVESDAETGIGYKVLQDDRIIGYLAIVDYDETYDAIEGKWLADGPYIALHRIAFSDSVRGKGLFSSLIAECEKLAEGKGALSIRIDTDKSNSIMQHLLEKLGFIQTGIVFFEGSGKLAYERLCQEVMV